MTNGTPNDYIGRHRRTSHSQPRWAAACRWNFEHPAIDWLWGLSFWSNDQSTTAWKAWELVTGQLDDAERAIFRDPDLYRATIAGVRHLADAMGIPFDAIAKGVSAQ